MLSSKWLKETIEKGEFQNVMEVVKLDTEILEQKNLMRPMMDTVRMLEAEKFEKMNIINARVYG